MNESIGYMLLQKMRDRNMSVSDLSKKSGLPESSIKNILQGKSLNPRIDTMMCLCEALNCSLEELAIMAKEVEDEKRRRFGDIMMSRPKKVAIPRSEDPFFQEHWDADLYGKCLQMSSHYLRIAKPNPSREEILEIVDFVYYTTVRKNKDRFDIRSYGEIEVDPEFVKTMVSAKTRYVFP